jgi:hypothetical protein
MQDFPEVRRLPNAYTSGIGRIVSRWAYLEWTMTEITHTLLRLNNLKLYRIAVRGGRAAEYVTMWREMLRVHGLSVASDLKDLAKRLQKIENERNLIAHGLWIRNPLTGALNVWLIRGTWDAGPNQGISHRIKPKAAPRSPADLTTTFRDIDALIVSLGALHEEVTRGLNAEPGATKKA